MLYLEYTDKDRVKRWELQSEEWPVVKAALLAAGVDHNTVDIVDAQVNQGPKDPDESPWIGHELDTTGGGCVDIEGELGPMGPSHPERRHDDPFQKKVSE